jgi:hypothetical protein
MIILDLPDSTPQHYYQLIITDRLCHNLAFSP